MPVEIPLGQGAVALIDNQDAELIMQYSWYLVVKPKNGRSYAFRSHRISTGKFTIVGMHRQIMDFPPLGMPVDHWDGDGLNNQRSNLRVTSFTKNRTNSVKKAASSSIYKGVSWNRGAWRANLCIDRKVKFIGSFKTEIDAALGFDAAARVRHGEFGTYNFPHPGERSALTGLIEPLFESIA